MGDWYYIGHYGQLGPLTREQIDELVEGGVIGRDTYVWNAGMDGWSPAERVRDLAEAFRAAQPFSTPPPPPSPSLPPGPAPPIQGFDPHLPQPNYTPTAVPMAYPALSAMRSDRSRTAAGVIQLFLPGVGRMYLGYLAYGVLQLVLAVGTCGFLWLWSFIDGIIILTGGVKLDGYGRQLQD